MPWVGMVRTVGAEERIFEACENAGAPPIIDYKRNDMWIEFAFSPEYLGAIQEEQSGNSLLAETAIGPNWLSLPAPHWAISCI